MIDLAVVVPTFNERENVGALVSRLETALAGLRWEVVFVDDDSPDGTAAAVRALAVDKPHVRCLHRIGRRGLTRAVAEGVMSTSAPLVAVLDADLQHDESLLPQMVQRLRDEGLDVVVGSRYAAGGSVGAWGHERLRLSRAATALAQRLMRVRLTDPMSGFFVIRRAVFEDAVRRISGEGYKVLLDVLLSSSAALRVAEQPYTFRPRSAGQSKLDSAVAWEFMMLLLDKRVGRWLPARFIVFAGVGSSGVLVHFAVLWALFKGLLLPFGWSQAAATLVAMTSNYALNNSLTYRDRRHRGLGLVRGLLSFYAICGLGVFANVGVATTLFDRQQTWWLAAGAGALVGTVWNYVASAAVTWRRA